MKKILVIVLAGLLAFGLFACKPDEGISVYTPDGAPALGLAYMMKHHTEVGGEKISYNVVNSATIKDYVLDGRPDIAVVPSNVAVAVYNAGADYKIAAVVSHGNLYLVGKNVTDFASLKGKVVATFGKGQIPDLVFKSLLKINDIEFVDSGEAASGKVALSYAATPADARDLLLDNKADCAFLAEPVATATINAADKGFSQIFDIQDEWKKEMAKQDKDYSNGFPQAVLLVKNTLKASIVDEFLAAAKQDNGWAESNAAEAVQLIKDNALSGSTVVMPNLSSAIIKRCNVNFVTENMAEYVGGFLATIKTYVDTSAVPKDAGVYY